MDTTTTTQQTDLLPIKKKRVYKKKVVVKEMEQQPLPPPSEETVIEQVQPPAKKKPKKKEQKAAPPLPSEETVIEQVQPPAKKKPKKKEAQEPTEKPKKTTKKTGTDKKAILLDALEKMRKKEVANKETWKARAYSIVIKQLKSLDKPVVTYEDLNDIKGIGKGLEGKIKELLETGSLKQLEDYNADGKIKIIDDLLKVHAIGPAKAKELVENNGIKSIEDLKDHPELLNDKQKMGLKYYVDFDQRIPRKEMEKHDEYIIDAIKRVDPKLQACLTGSYRRKMKDSGDIDVLITHPDDPEDYEPIFKAIVENLHKEYIKDTFALGGKKCMAVCKLKRHRMFRRLDLLYTKKHEYPFALMYFTGSGEFNVDVRNRALSQGYSLSEYGMKYNTGEKKGEFIDHVFNDEKDIFEFLGMEFVPPEKRTNYKKK
jgi:DNA polymerase/3'-5' exonuclease PolX